MGRILVSKKNMSEEKIPRHELKLRFQFAAFAAITTSRFAEYSDYRQL